SVHRQAAAQPAPITGLTTTNGTLDAKAQPDECFIAVGLNIPFAQPNATTGVCTLGFPKVNQSYVWAMTRTKTTTWVGTTANPQSIAQGGLALDATQLHGYEPPSSPGESGSSVSAALKILPAGIADSRPPQMFAYDIATRRLTNVTPTIAPTPLNPLGF